MTKTIHHTQQLGFEALLLDADRTNHARELEKRNGHLPATMEDALPFFWELLEAHHEAMLGGMVEEVAFYREQARNLALRLNGDEPGFLADETSPGCVLVRETEASPDAVPLCPEFAVGGERAGVQVFSQEVM